MPQHMWGEMWAPQRDRTPELRVVPSYSISRINRIDKTDRSGAFAVWPLPLAEKRSAPSNHRACVEPMGS